MAITKKNTYAPGSNNDLTNAVLNIDYLRACIPDKILLYGNTILAGSFWECNGNFYSNDADLVLPTVPGVLGFDEDTLTFNSYTAGILVPVSGTSVHVGVDPLRGRLYIPGTNTRLFPYACMDLCWFILGTDPTPGSALVTPTPTGYLDKGVVSGVVTGTSVGATTKVSALFPADQTPSFLAWPTLTNQFLVPMTSTLAVLLYTTPGSSPTGRNLRAVRRTGSALAFEGTTFSLATSTATNMVGWRLNDTDLAVLHLAAGVVKLGTYRYNPGAGTFAFVSEVTVKASGGTTTNMRTFAGADQTFDVSGDGTTYAGYTWNGTAWVSDSTAMLPVARFFSPRTTSLTFAYGTGPGEHFLTTSSGILARYLA